MKKIGEILGAFVGNSTGGIVESVGKVVDEFTISKEEKAAINQAVQNEINRHKEEMLKMESEIEKAYLADTSNAREMQVAALNQEDKFSKRFLYYFTIHWSLFAVAYLIGITFFEIPQENIRIVDTILGFMLGTAMAGMFSYFYGSSFGSKKRNDEVYKAIGDKLKN